MTSKDICVIVGIGVVVVVVVVLAIEAIMTKRKEQNTDEVAE
jgi:hypothetical protein